MKPSKNGFTLPEMLIALATTAILLAAVGPSVRNTLNTYTRVAATRDLISEIRRAQSLAVTRGGIYAFQWGGEAATGRSASEYRLVRDTTKACSLPALNAVQDGTNVIRTWRNLGADYGGVSIQSMKDASNNDVYKIMFNSMGQAVNTCTATTFPVTINVADNQGRTRSILVQAAGWANPQ